jgi:hypothetical protein
MTITAIRHRLISYLTNADDSKVKAVFTLLEKQIAEKQHFILSDKQLQILDMKRELHLNTAELKPARFSRAKECFNVSIDHSFFLNPEKRIISTTANKIPMGISRVANPTDNPIMIAAT